MAGGLWLVRYGFDSLDGKVKYLEGKKRLSKYLERLP
jgi:hypothetical protein